MNMESTGGKIDADDRQFGSDDGLDDVVHFCRDGSFKVQAVNSVHNEVVGVGEKLGFRGEVVEEWDSQPLTLPLHRLLQWVRRRVAVENRWFVTLP